MYYNWMAKMQIVALVLLLLSLLITGVYFIYDEIRGLKIHVFQISINPNKIIFETDEKFLSVALDTSFMGCTFHHLNGRDWEKLEYLSKLLSPAYIRLGGTLADRTIFSLNENTFVQNNNCMNIQPNETIIITAKDWKKVYQFANNSGFSFIMDLNVLLRSNSEWNSSNAKSLINFSEQNGFQLDFQLGNEPNSFPHVFHIDIPGAQLARDFYTLRRILKSTKAYRKSKLIGPDVTRPKNLGERSLKYLEEFLNKDVVDVVSWHQYYLNGRTATLEDFINPKTLDLLPPQIKAVVRTVRKFSSTSPIWLTYGQGAPKLSNRFAASFLWLDKLGMAARLGISVVIRQTLFEKYYALITNHFRPTPDFWISLLYKKLVGTGVIDFNDNNKSDELRLYAHCLASNCGVNGNVVIYGLNLKNSTENFDLPGLKIKSTMHAYIFKPALDNLKSKDVLLNNKLLIYNETEVPDLVKMSEEVELPFAFHSYTIGFWVLEVEKTACA